MYRFKTLSSTQSLNRSKEFEDQSWNPYDDICAIKTFDRTSNPVKKVSSVVEGTHLASYIILLP